MSHACNLLILFEIIRHKSVNSGIEFDSLGFEVLNLLLEGGVLAKFRGLQSLFSLIQLSFKIVKRLLLKCELVLKLSLKILLMLLEICKLFLKVFKL